MCVHIMGLVKGDVLVAIRFPPCAEDAIKACKEARPKGADIVAITNSIISPTATGAKVLIEVNDAQLLGLGLALRLRASARHYKEVTPLALG